MATKKKSAGAAKRSYGAGKGKLFGKLEGTFVFRTRSKKPSAKQMKFKL